MRTALIIGRAGGTWDDVAAAASFLRMPFDLVVAVNDSGHDYPRVDHWVSFHGDKFERWIKVREERGYPPVKRMWTSTCGRLESAYEKRLGQLGVAKVAYAGGGSSGLVAAVVARVHLEASHIVLAGVPMDSEAGHYNAHGPWKEATKHRSAWEAKRDELGPYLRSMSGWTAAVFGRPTREWLDA